ncbi:hypothetical protein MB02_01725 [Croceicoccus estronivorus]|uniref:L,D-transpeptidase family protein n=1 Tax=Croceicoccus estronivorus TaxID=1172626 RepID=UPI000835C249|nr:L,D-transpeptidase family protein [Croceicoccus estronivorus]OCC25399.1 hypothetical protein MB02_01725 [Croceicoccus estronivorus]
MKRGLLAIIALLSCTAAAAAAESPNHWSYSNISALRRWAAMAPADALPPLPSTQLDTAVASGDQDAIDREADALAFKLAKMHLLGAASSTERAGWNIVDTDKEIDLVPLLNKALAGNTLDTFYASLRPRHPDYATLRAAYASEADPDRRATIARNMERWRWMPQSLGPDYVLVNTALFEASLWHGNQRTGTWKVIVGKKSTPTPVFQATITGVILNPWWEIPASIVRESVGALARRNPSLAHARGYVWSNGRYRQKPGPNNALGQMKLVMPNRFSVYMHDTPSKQLFERDVRAFSHGCIRTGDAIGYAATLLQGVMTLAEVDAIVASGKTTTIPLAQSLPVYITYFTAATNADGELVIQPDIYGRDRRIRLSHGNAEEPLHGCAA